MRFKYLLILLFFFSACKKKKIKKDLIGNWRFNLETFTSTNYRGHDLIFNENRTYNELNVPQTIGYKYPIEYKDYQGEWTVINKNEIKLFSNSNESFTLSILEITNDKLVITRNPYLYTQINLSLGDSPPELTFYRE